MRISLSRLSPILLIILAACIVDNSGGDAPIGDTASFHVVDTDSSCGVFDDTATLVRNADEAHAAGETCSADGDLVTDRLTDALDLLPEGDALVFVTIALGGCLEGHSVRGMFIDGDVLRPWIVKQDTAYGVANAACTDDLGEAVRIYQVEGAADLTDAELHIGVMNPNFEPPVGLSTSELESE
jgi:hypothetical protein